MPDLARVGFAEVVAYRSELVIWILTATLPLVMLAMWDAVVADGPVQGFDRDAIARYFVATLIVRQLGASWLVWEVNDDIRTGALSGQLLRPVDPLLVKAVPMVMALPLRLLVLAPILSLVILARPGLVVWPGVAAFALFAWTMVVAWCMNLAVQACFCALSFWIDKSDGLFGLWLAVWSLLSGYVAPMAMFPEATQHALRWLPFRGMLALPVEILTGFLSPRDAVADIAIQALWVVVLATLGRFSWRAGLRRYGAFGA